MLLTTPAVAQVDPTTDYNVELSNGPIVAPSHIVGMGGAYVSIAEGSGAQVMNPAAAANRMKHNADLYFDWDWAFDWLIATRAPGGTDIENSGRQDSPDDTTGVLTGAINVYVAEFGIGLTVATRTVDIQESGCTEQLPSARFNSTQLGLSIGYNLMGGQLVIGGSLVLATANTDRCVGSDHARILDMSGLGLVAGGIARPEGKPYRFGVMISSPMQLGIASDFQPAAEIGDTPIPKAIVAPWQLVIGMSYSLGSRANNLTTTFGAERANLALSSVSTSSTASPRDYITFAVDLVLTGQTNDSIGFGAWSDGALSLSAAADQRAGEDLTFGFRVGIDSEFWDNRMRGRLGAYWEPSRIRATNGRIHGTAGLELRLGELIWNWRTGAAFDLAPRYANLMLSLGFWY